MTREPVVSRARPWLATRAVALALPAAVFTAGGASSLLAQNGDVANATPPARSSDSTAAAEAARDSAALHHRARDAQARFERRRRALLPVTWAAGSRCDVHIGRFCYWYDEQGPAGPEEPERVARERGRLLAVLGAAAAALPADGWIAGQRVRYHLEADQVDSALADAEACAAEAEWCARLRGLAHHAAGDAAAADSAFAAARALLPEDERCRRADLGPLLAADARERLAALPCAARDSLVERWWWLSTPFLSRGGNDRRNEHEARLVLARLLAESRTAYASRWREDLTELLVRYGWPHRWSRRANPSPSSAGSAVGVVGHDPSPAYRFAPVARLLDAPYDAVQRDWPLRDPDAVERYAPTFTRWIHDIPAAGAVLRRGDSLLVIATYRAPGDPVALRNWVGSPLTLVLAHEGEPPRLVRDTLRGPVGALAIRGADRPHLAALEILGDTVHAARARFAVHPPALHDGFGVSDVVLFDAGGAPADASAPVLDSAGDSTAADPQAGASAPGAPLVSLADVLASPLGDDALDAPRRLGLYWELYGLGGGAQAVETSLVIAGEDRPGWLARAWERLRRAPPRTPVQMRWTDVGPGGEVAARSVTVELPALPAGEYALELRVADRAGRVATARRTLTVRAR